MAEPLLGDDQMWSCAEKGCGCFVLAVIVLAVAIGFEIAWQLQHLH